MAGVHPLRRWAVFLLRAGALIAALYVVYLAITITRVVALGILNLLEGRTPSPFSTTFLSSGGLGMIIQLAGWLAFAFALAKYSLPLAVWLTPPDPALGGGSCARCGHPMVKANKGVCPECGLSGQ